MATVRRDLHKLNMGSVVWVDVMSKCVCRADAAVIVKSAARALTAFGSRSVWGSSN